MICANTSCLHYKFRNSLNIKKLFLNNREHFRYSNSRNISLQRNRIQDLRDSREDVADENQQLLSPGSIVVPLSHRLPPVPDHFHERQNARGGVRSVDRERRWRRRKRRKDPWHSGRCGRDGGSWRPRRASSASSESGRFCFLSVRAFASDKPAVIADERAVFRGDDTCRAQLTARFDSSRLDWKLRSANATPTPTRRMGTYRSVARWAEDLG